MWFLILVIYFRDLFLYFLPALGRNFRLKKRCLRYEGSSRSFFHGVSCNCLKSPKPSGIHHPLLFGKVKIFMISGSPWWKTTIMYCTGIWKGLILKCSKMPSYRLDTHLFPPGNCEMKFQYPCYVLVVALAKTVNRNRKLKEKRTGNLNLQNWVILLRQSQIRILVH